MGLKIESLSSLLIVLCSSVLGLAGNITLTKLDVPQHVGVNDSTKLECIFELGGHRLYSVKWYKDDNEFYRYMPNNEPQKQNFALSGITLDLFTSDMNKVQLATVNFESSGVYTCEVSTEGPNFETSLKKSNMTVVVYPTGNPKIEGFESKYSPDQYVTGNCTSAPSNPQSEITWYINGIQADDMLIERYRTVETAGPLYSHSLGLRFQIQDNKQFMRDADGVIELKCRVTLPGLPPEKVWDSIKKIYSLSYRNQMLGNQERFLNLGSQLEAKRELMTSLLLLFAWLTFT